MYDSNLKRKITRKMWVLYYLAKGKKAKVRTPEENKLVRDLDNSLKRKI